MDNIHYFAPETIEEAVAYLAENDSVKILAGGTDLIAKWKKIGHPDMSLMDIRNIAGISDLYLRNEKIFIGAGVTMAAIFDSPEIREELPVLAEAAGKVGSVQVRNLATIGGNSCNAAPSADTVLPLIAYGAEAVIVSRNTERFSPLSDFFAGPGKTTMCKGEMLKGFVIPKPQKNSVAAFAKHSRRPGMDLATVGVAVKADFEEDGSIKDLTVVLGAVGPTPIALEHLEQYKGLTLSKENIKKIAEETGAAATPITDVRGSKEYRTKMIVEQVEELLTKIKVSLK